jgi:hypothetical protein
MVWAAMMCLCTNYTPFGQACKAILRNQGNLRSLAHLNGQSVWSTGDGKYRRDAFHAVDRHSDASLPFALRARFADPESDKQFRDIDTELLSRI